MQLEYPYFPSSGGLTYFASYVKYFHLVTILSYWLWRNVSFAKNIFIVWMHFRRFTELNWCCDLDICSGCVDCSLFQFTVWVGRIGWSDFIQYSCRSIVMASSPKTVGLSTSSTSWEVTDLLAEPAVLTKEPDVYTSPNGFRHFFVSGKSSLTVTSFIIFDNF